MVSLLLINDKNQTQFPVTCSRVCVLKDMSNAIEMLSNPAGTTEPGEPHFWVFLLGTLRQNVCFSCGCCRCCCVKKEFYFRTHNFFLAVACCDGCCRMAVCVCVCVCLFGVNVCL